MDHFTKTMVRELLVALKLRALLETSFKSGVPLELSSKSCALLLDILDECLKDD